HPIRITCHTDVHTPTTHSSPTRRSSDLPRDHPPENIYYVMIPPPHGRNAHARHQRQHCPEQPPPVSPCAPQCRGRPCHVLGRKRDRKSTRLNSSHQIISYAVFCLKKKRT